MSLLLGWWLRGETAFGSRVSGERISVGDLTGLRDAIEVFEDAWCVSDFGIIATMSAQFDDIEKQARMLPMKQKAALARVLIEDLDTALDEDVEDMWIEEAQRRYAAYQKGDLEALPGDEVMKRVRQRLK